MKINKTLTALIASAGLGLTGQALAAGTTAGTAITNIATMTYTVGSTPISETDNAKLTVDTKVDLTFDWTDGIKVTAAAGTSAILKLTLSNDGNLVQPFKFTVGESANGFTLPSFTAPNNTDNEDTVGTTTFYLDDDPASSDTLDTVNDTELTSDIITAAQLPLDTPTIIWAVTSLEDTSLDTDRIGLEIKAQAVNGSGVALTEDTSTNKNDDQTTLDSNLIVFADDPSVDNTLVLSGGANRDGAYVVLTEIDVEAASLEVTKDVEVISDVLSSANPRAIPGSVVEYTVTVENTGAVAADSVDFLDDLTFDIDADGSNDIDRATINITSVNVTGLLLDSDFTPTAATAQAIARDSDVANTDYGKIKFNFDSIGKDETLVVTFRATIK